MDAKKTISELSAKNVGKLKELIELTNSTYNLFYIKVQLSQVNSGIILAIVAFMFPSVLGIMCQADSPCNAKAYIGIIMLLSLISLGVACVFAIIAIFPRRWLEPDVQGIVNIAYEYDQDDKLPMETLNTLITDNKLNLKYLKLMNTRALYALICALILFGICIFFTMTTHCGVFNFLHTSPNPS